MKKEDKENLRYEIHNCHTHAFTIDYIPKYFIGKLLPTWLAKKKWIANLGMLFIRKKLSRYNGFFYSALKNDQSAVIEELINYYPSSAKFCVLSIDFDYMKAGSAKYGFLEQINDLAMIAKTINEQSEREKILPFIGVDPRRDKINELVKEYIEEKNFKGIKIYPSLGFFPDDERLFKVYEYAEKNQIPITAHCLPKNKTHFRYSPSPEMIAKASKLPDYESKFFRKRYHFAKYLNDPFWYEIVLKNFPNLKINLAHFGGNKEWDRYLDQPNDGKEKDFSWYKKIRDLLKKYPNVYSDISFTVHDRNLYPLLKNLIRSNYTKQPYYSPADKILFGTDFYMLQKDYKERRFGIDLRGYLSDEEYWQIAEVNPKKFLKNNIHS